MTLKNRINEDMKAAMRAREVDRLSAIRMLHAAIKQKEIDERVEADDALVLGIVDKLVKQRRDSATQYEQAGRPELAARERAEIDVLSAYLPQQASAEELTAEIEAAIAASGASGPQDMGRVMGVLKPRLAGRADMAQVSAQLRSRLAVR
ncbi:MAG TPA: GatB/YqeY domain-containing protein [Burkholderiaceae bacterium]|nr:GatB/YqeY domain-containing protein [Burkholderiaceae bacterium]